MAGYPVYIDSLLRSLSEQVRPAAHNTVSKKLLEHRPSQCQELPETDENTMKVPNRPLRTDLLGQGPTGHIIYF
jgi:hypothetical protein